MKILFDNGKVFHARRLGWHELRNGELLQRAEDEGYDVFVTTDKNLRHQQNLNKRSISIVVLTNSQWPNVKAQLESIAAAVNSSRPGSYVEVENPRMRTASVPLS